MADLNIRNVDEELIQKIRIASVTSGITIRAWVVNHLWACLAPGVRITAPDPRKHAESLRSASKALAAVSVEPKHPDDVVVNGSPSEAVGGPTVACFDGIHDGCVHVGSPIPERCEHRVASICDECAKISKKSK